MWQEVPFPISFIRGKGRGKKNIKGTWELGEGRDMLKAAWRRTSGRMSRKIPTLPKEKELQ